MKAIVLSLISIALFSSFTPVTLKPVASNDAVTFVIKNFGFDTKCSLGGLTGNIKWDAANPAASQVVASVDVNTINTGVDSRDEELKTEKYFNYPRFHNITFVSTAVSATSITGALTIKGITKSVTFPITVKPSGAGYLFEGEFTINRLDYTVGESSMVLSDKVKITLKVQANP